VRLGQVRSVYVLLIRVSSCQARLVRVNSG